MTIPFIAILRTDRPLERGVTLSAQFRSQVEFQAADWLNNLGQHGDSFEVFEMKMVPLGVIDCQKPKPEPKPRTGGRHEFKVGKTPLRCETCAGTREDHR